MNPKAIHIDDDEDWQYNIVGGIFTRPGKMPDIIQTVIHGVGHLLGLNHSKLVESVMHPYAERGILGTSYALHHTDIKAVKDLYGMLLNS